MRYTELKQIVKHIIKQIACPHCEARYKEDRLHVLGTLPDEALFFTQCIKCKSQVLINVAFSQEGEDAERMLPENLQIQTAITPGISYDDFLDVKNFLNNFNGDFKKLFSPKK